MRRSSGPQCSGRCRAPPSECRACQDGLVIIPPVPVPLRVFCDLLRRDQGRMLGSAVLFASVVGLDVVEQRKGDIAAISGVPATRVQEIVWAAVSVATSMRAWPEGPAPRLTTSSHSAARKSVGRSPNRRPVARSAACTHTSRDRSLGTSVAGTARPCGHD